MPKQEKRPANSPTGAVAPRTHGFSKSKTVKSGSFQKPKQKISENPQKYKSHSVQNFQKANVHINTPSEKQNRFSEQDLSGQAVSALCIPGTFSTVHLPELLAPAGSPEALAAALDGGADAVYLGGQLFNARMNARNFDDAAMRQAVDACHRRGCRLYVTLNTLIYDRELSDALRYAAFLYECGVDALIVCDLGLISLLRRHLPDFPLHASTQLSGHNAQAAKFCASLGLSRMVCARELSRENVARLCKESPIEIEQFVHGALCASHSGQCLASSMIGGRSGNRGACAQPCRMVYNGTYPLSLKDLCLAGRLSEVVASGVASLKIEGRMKSPDYVYGVTSIYRRLLDAGKNASEDDIRALAAIFSRGGFTDGYYASRMDETMCGVRSEADKQASAKTARHREQCAPPRAPLSYERNAVAVPKIPLPREKNAPKPISVRAQFATLAQVPAQKTWDLGFLPLAAFSEEAVLRGITGVVLPPVLYDDQLAAVEQALLQAKALGATHGLVGNVGHLALCQSVGLCIHGDFRFNVANAHSARALLPFLVDYLVSPELALPQIRDLPEQKGAIVYGRLPLMLLEKPLAASVLHDRTGAAFPVRNAGTRSILYNSVPTDMRDRAAELSAAGVFLHHYLFTIESAAQAGAILAGAPLPAGTRFRRYVGTP